MSKRDVPEKQNCKQCGRSKSLKDFPSSFASRFGVRSTCKDCTKKNKRKWTEDNAAKLKRENAEKHAKLQKESAEYRARKNANARRAWEKKKGKD
jgi:hypothetical protein